MGFSGFDDLVELFLRTSLRYASVSLANFDSRNFRSSQAQERVKPWHWEGTMKARAKTWISRRLRSSLKSNRPLLRAFVKAVSHQRKPIHQKTNKPKLQGDWSKFQPFYSSPKTNKELQRACCQACFEVDVVDVCVRYFPVFFCGRGCATAIEDLITVI